MNLLSYPALRYCHRTDGGSVTSRFVPDFFDQQCARVARLLSLYDGWGMTDARVLGVLGAAYARYLLSGLERTLDPRAHMDAAARRDFLRAALAGVEPGRPQSYAGQLRPLLAQEALMGVDLCACGLAGRVEDYFKRMLAGPGAVRRTLREALGRQSDREE